MKKLLLASVLAGHAEELYDDIGRSDWLAEEALAYLRERFTVEDIRSGTHKRCLISKDGIGIIGDHEN